LEIRSRFLVQTNDIFENAILAYARSADGTVTLAGRYHHGPRWYAGLRRRVTRPIRSRRKAH
jgi:hypothetical protein